MGHLRIMNYANFVAPQSGMWARPIPTFAAWGRRLIGGSLRSIITQRAGPCTSR
jgi:hypothetical protein